jgi:protochlorophyllide reductase
MTGWNQRDIPDLGGRIAVVTGANSGLGEATVTALAGCGARVVMACRDRGKAEAARKRVLAATGADPGLLSVGALDLGTRASVAAFAEEFVAGHDRLDILINNAGLGFLNESRTVDGFETTFAVNHLGHMALTLRLLPLLARAEGSRVVSVSSNGYRVGRIRLSDPNFNDGGYGRTRAYTQSKMANVLFALELHRRLRAAGREGPASIAAAPGGGRTSLGTKDTSRAMLAVGKLSRVLPSPSIEEGAGPQLRAATDPAARSGELYGPSRLSAFGPPVLWTPTERAADEETARRLWRTSMEMLAMDEPSELTPRAGQAH